MTSMLDGIKVVTVVGYKAPEGVPADCIIFNAPRPLLGNFDWVADFITGTLYVGVLPGDPRAKDWIDFNRRMDAVIIQPLDVDMFEAQVKAFKRETLADYAKLGYPVENDVPFIEWVEMYINTREAPVRYILRADKKEWHD